MNISYCFKDVINVISVDVDSNRNFFEFFFERIIP